MAQQIPLYIFEDPGWRRFASVTTWQPVWELRLGLESLLERIARFYDRQPGGLLPRAGLRDVVADAAPWANVGRLPSDGEVLLVNGRLLGDLPEEGLEPDCPWSIWTDGPDVAAARLPATVARRWTARPVYEPMEYSAQALLGAWNQEMPAPEVRVHRQEGSLAWWPWDLLERQEAAIGEALGRLGRGIIDGEVEHRAVLLEESNMHLDRGVHVAAGAVLDASEGPIVMSDNVRVMPGAVVRGPVAVDRDSVIKPHAHLYGGTVLGPVCKVGGEVEGCLFLGYSNKQHDGFLGHSLVGRWVNLGAATNNSDLKNNYSPVSVQIEGEVIPTERTFFGAVLGDHVKTAIGTLLNTGSVVGVATNLYGRGFPPKAVGAFRWGGDDEFAIYDIDRFLDTARRVMERRDVELTPAMISLMRRTHADVLAGRI